jgi:muramoyltetrapeptide carboxypeptidase LdcA involved in peptidoglycan recycling
MYFVSKPEKLRQGDIIAVISPSSGLGNICKHRIISGINALEKLSFEVKEYPTSKKINDEGSAGTPQERADDICAAFESQDVKGIICSIGGLSANEVLDKIDYNVIKKNPKIFCGYSDITLLHHALYKKANLITFYGPNLMTQFGEYPIPFEYTVSYFLKALTIPEIGVVKASKFWTDEVLDWYGKKDLLRKRNCYENVDGHLWLRKGKASGKITGGCLYSLLQIKGTEYEINYEQKILFLDIPEGQSIAKGTPIEYVNSQLMDLRNAGVFDKIKGLIVGRGFGYTQNENLRLRNLILKHTNNYNFPVLTNVNIGHTDPIITLPLNVNVTLDFENDIFSIDENGVID